MATLVVSPAGCVSTSSSGAEPGFPGRRARRHRVQWSDRGRRPCAAARRPTGVRSATDAADAPSLRQPRFRQRLCKIRLLLAHLGLPYAWSDLGIFHGASRTPEFLAKEPERPHPDVSGSRDGTTSSPSRTRSSGTSPRARRSSRWTTGSNARKVLQWMFFEQYSHEPYVATSRFILRHLPANSPRHPGCRPAGARAAGDRGDGEAPRVAAPISSASGCPSRTSRCTRYARRRPGRSRPHAVSGGARPG